MKKRFFFLLMLSSGALSADQSEQLRHAVSVENIREHQRQFQTIADDNNGTRVAGGPGFTASVEYVRSRMEQAGYAVSLQEFSFFRSVDNSLPVLREIGPEQHSFIAHSDFSSMSGVGYNAIEAQVEAVDLQIPSPYPNYSTSGCELDDFRNFTRGNVALMQRGTCTFQQKAENALRAGAIGAIIFNEGNPTRTDFIESRLPTSLGSFPVVGASFEVGNVLRAGSLNGSTGKRVLMRVDVIARERMVKNVIAETHAGDDKRVVVVGAHLDSVEAGPGMNDNGSGSAVNLTIAEQYARLNLSPKNKLRFIWFAAEEFGLLGSEHYVRSLSSQERLNILSMLNFDMLGSSNYARFVYDGDNPSAPEGSAYIERVFLDYFLSQNLVTHKTAFNGRSDYGPFIERGIPAGGLFSGAEGRKSAALAAIYGGRAGVAFDPCYHRACDNFQNTGETETSALALKSIDELSDAAAHTVVHIASTDDQIRRPTERIPSPGFDFEYRGGLLIK